MRHKIEQMREELSILKENLFHSDCLKNDLLLVYQIKRLIIQIQTDEATWMDEATWCVRKWTEI